MRFSDTSYTPNPAPGEPGSLLQELGAIILFFRDPLRLVGDKDRTHQRWREVMQGRRLPADGRQN